MSERNGKETMPEPSKEMKVFKGVTGAVARPFNFVPQTIAEARDFAKIMANSTLVPKGYQGKADDCFIAMQWGGELGMAPMQAVQNIAVINGKPGIYGDLGKAMLQSKGFKIEERDIKEVEAKGEAWCRITRPDNGVVIERTFSRKNAEQAKLWGREGVWSTYPFRQMAWRAFWYAARDGAADILKGMGGAEEIMDVVETTIVEDTSAPREMKPAPAAEPTPQNPVVDAAPETKPNVEVITPEERKHIVGLLQKHNVNPAVLKDHLREKYGIEDDKTPTKHIPRASYADVCKWIEDPQETLGV